MRNLWLVTCLTLAPLTLGCDVEQTREGELPDIDIEANAGRLPAFDVDWADVDVGTTTKMVKVPKLVVVMDEVEVEVPYMDFDMPGGSDKEEQTITVEMEVEGENHDLYIDEIYGTESRLIVVSRLEPNGEALEDQRVRIADRVVINAPELDVRHYVIGTRPEGDWNRRYRFVSSRAELADTLEGTKRIYSRSRGEARP